jgi:hypothetical protein
MTQDLEFDSQTGGEAEKLEIFPRHYMDNLSLLYKTNKTFDIVGKPQFTVYEIAENKYLKGQYFEELTTPTVNFANDQHYSDVLSGTLTIQSYATTIVGSGTSFLTDFKIGDMITVDTVNSDDKFRRVVNIIDNETMAVHGFYNHDVPNLNYRWGIYGNSNIIIDLDLHWFYLWAFVTSAGVISYVMSTRHQEPDVSDAGLLTRPLKFIPSTVKYIRRLGFVHTNSSGEIDQIGLYYEGMPKTGNIGDIKPWHKNYKVGGNDIDAITKYMEYGWFPCDARYVDLPESPLYATVLPNLNADGGAIGRILKGAATSGTLLDATRIGVEVWNDAGNVQDVKAWIDDYDGSIETISTIYRPIAAGNTAVVANHGVRVRPTTMSVIMLMKVIQNC